jgi:GGDEF domain-containing protein
LSSEDPVFSELVSIIRQNTRDSDILGLLPDNSLSVILHAAEREVTEKITERIQEKVQFFFNNKPKAKPIAIGWSCFPTHAATAEELIISMERRKIQI